MDRNSKSNCKAGQVWSSLWKMQGRMPESGKAWEKKAAVIPVVCISVLLTACGLCASNGEARRLVQQGGVAVSDKKVTDIAAAFDQGDFAGEGVVIKKGKKVFHRAYTKA